jgi:competence protein ComEC
MFTNLNNKLIDLIWLILILTPTLLACYNLIIIPQKYLRNKKYFSPLIMATIALILGIYAQSFSLFNTACLLAGIVFSSLILIIFAVKRISSVFSKTFAYLTFFILGAYLLVIQNNRYNLMCSEFDGKTLDLIAKVTSKKKPYANKWKEILELSVEQYREEGEQAYNQTNFNLQCYSTQNTNIQVDDIIKLEDIKIRVPEAKSGSYKNYLIKEGFLCSIFLYKKITNIIHSPKFSIKRWISNTKNKLCTSLQSKITLGTFTYFSLIFLGNSGRKDADKLRSKFNHWGISHYLARSGLHIILLILIWTFFLRFIPVTLNFKKLFLIFICLIYSIFSWSSIPFARAFYAFIITEVGKILNFQTNFLHILSIICMTVLLFNPMQLFFLDFQLTFALTFALSFVSKFLN